jgi:hypothetical protein
MPSHGRRWSLYLGLVRPHAPNLSFSAHFEQCRRGLRGRAQACRPIYTAAQDLRAEVRGYGSATER